MQISKLAKLVGKYLAILAILAATVAGLLIGKHLYSTSSDFQSRTSPQRDVGPNNPQLPIVQGTLDPCGVAVYTSFPPKCRTFNGEFIPLPGASLYVVMTPEGK